MPQELSLHIISATNLAVCLFDTLVPTLSNLANSCHWCWVNQHEGFQHHLMSECQHNPPPVNMDVKLLTKVIGLVCGHKDFKPNCRNLRSLTPNFGFILALLLLTLCSIIGNACLTGVGGTKGLSIEAIKAWHFSLGSDDAPDKDSSFNGLCGNERRRKCVGHRNFSFGSRLYVDIDDNGNRAKLTTVNQFERIGGRPWREGLADSPYCPR